MVLQRGDLRRAAKRLHPSFLPSPTVFCSSPSWGQRVFCSPKFPFRAWELHLGKGWCLYLEQYAARVLREVARLLGSVIASHHPHPPEPRASCPRTPMSYVSAHPTSWPVLCVTCHHFARQMGHLGREEAAVLPPRASSIRSLHIHTGSLYLTNNYLTKYANSIITVICLAIMSV